MNKKLVFIGKSCSGKTTIANELNKYGLKTQLSTTSRPKRKIEKNNVDYEFILENEFNKRKINNKFIETDVFNGWFYGLSHKEFEKSDILILTPRGLKKLLEKIPRENFFIVFLETSISLRKERINNRGDEHDSLYRRWVADDIDFENWGEWGHIWDMKISIQNNNAIIELIKIITNK